MKKCVVISTFLCLVFGNFLFIRAEETRLSPEDLALLAESRLKSMQQELKKIGNDIKKLEEYLDTLIGNIRSCKVQAGDSMIQGLSGQVNNLKARLNSVENKILTGKEPNFQDMMKAVESRLSEVNNDLTNKQRALESVRDERKQTEERRNTLHKQIEENRERSFPQDPDKLNEFNELTEKLEELEFEENNLQGEINKLNAQKAALSAVLDLYNNILSDIAGLRVEIGKLDLKIELLRKLKPLKTDIMKEKNPDKRKELIEKMYELIDELDRAKKDLEKIKKSKVLEKIMNGIKEKIEKFKEKLNEIIKKSLPITPPSAPRHWGIQISGFFRWIDMSALNNYLKWINATFNGNIEKLKAALGGSLSVFYQLNSTFSIGASYEYMKASSEGTISITAPPTTLTHSQSVSVNGLFGIVRIDIPLNISRLVLRAIGGAGLYFGNYYESENGYDVEGTGTGFGYKAGFGIHYEFADGFESGTTMSWSGGSINQFKDNAGNTLQFISAYQPNEDISANFSGFSVSLNFTIKF